MSASIRMLLLLLFAAPAEAATLYKAETTNFVVIAQTKNNARYAAIGAESWRKYIARDLFSVEFPAWTIKSTIRIRQNPNEEGAGGSTNVGFIAGEVNGLDCTLIGPIQKIMDNAIPHEVCHMVVASYFRKPIPRWIDEGLAVQYETKEMKDTWEQYMAKALHNKEAVKLNHLVNYAEYPQNHTAFYAQSASTTDYLIRWKGKKPLLNALRWVFKGTTWNQAVVQTYGVNLDEIENAWNRDFVSRPSYRLFGRRPGGGLFGRPGMLRGTTHSQPTCNPSDPNCGIGGGRPTFVEPLLPDYSAPIPDAPGMQTGPPAGMQTGPPASMPTGPAPELPVAPVPDDKGGTIDITISGSHVTREVFESETLKLRAEMDGLAKQYAKQYSEEFTRTAVREYMEANGHLYKGADGTNGQDGEKGDSLSVADIDVLRQQIVLEMKSDPSFKGPTGDVGKPGRPPKIDVVVDEVLKNLPPTPSYYQILPRTRASAKAMSP